jgi:hypothetical protein
MELNEGAQTFQRYLNQKHEKFKRDLDKLLEVLVDEDKVAKKTHAETFCATAQNLRDNLSDQDSPNWLNKSLNGITTYLGNINSPGINHTLIKNLISIYQSAISYKWQNNDPPDILAFDFDSIYEQCKSESRIDELFDNIISYLKKIIDSKEIDSIKVKDSLDRLIATLNKHTTASYFSLHSMWDFLNHLMNNILWEVFENTPGIKEIVKGLRKTLEETGVELKDLHLNIGNVMSQKYNGDFPFLNSNSTNLLEKHNHE